MSLGLIKSEIVATTSSEIDQPPKRVFCSSSLIIITTL
jgi:hypothetical protein